MSATDLRHLKLSNGDEIVAEVVHYSRGDDAVLRRAMRILPHPLNFMQFIARPWFQNGEDAEDAPLVVSGSSIVAMTVPVAKLIDYHGEFMAFCDNLKADKEDADPASSDDSDEPPETPDNVISYPFGKPLEGKDGEPQC